MTVHDRLLVTLMGDDDREALEAFRDEAGVRSVSRAAAMLIHDALRDRGFIHYYTDRDGREIPPPAVGEAHSPPPFMRPRRLDEPPRRTTPPRKQPPRTTPTEARRRRGGGGHAAA